MSLQELQAAQVRRLKWACRRGMLELDVLLEPFVDNHYLSLDPAQQALFERLLGCDDPELFAWFMGHERCPDLALASMVALIRERNVA
ncbi:succinate dehydrogenase assembly factor 2 [Ferrimonas senticii]|uniref:FAD assembly factor SdhE n=1 Tax=Ferrimonas senticii TaxID=394566 RepID=UPI000426A3D9|nr:succinate dehydrogenase assembly factor 2 [Ferrimonas senticii]